MVAFWEQVCEAPHTAILEISLSLFFFIMDLGMFEKEHKLTSSTSKISIKVKVLRLVIIEYLIQSIGLLEEKLIEGKYVFYLRCVYVSWDNTNCVYFYFMILNNFDDNDAKTNQIF